jgi:hypothetical protein
MTTATQELQARLVGECRDMVQALGTEAGTSETQILLKAAFYCGAAMGLNAMGHRAEAEAVRDLSMHEAHIIDTLRAMFRA